MQQARQALRSIALVAGVRAAALTALPIGFGVLLGEPALLWMGLNAWLVGLADAGGAYSTRAAGMAAVTASQAAACLLAWAVAPVPWLLAPFMFAVGVGFALLRVIGNVGALLGPMVVVFVAIAIGDPPESFGDAVARALAVTGGGALTLGVSLALWPIHPYRPVRRAAARLWTTLADTVDALRSLVTSDADDAEWAAWTRQTPRSIRAAFEAARSALWSTRSNRSAGSFAGEQLDQVLSNADLAFAELLAFGHQLEEAHRPAEVERTAAIDALQFVADACRRLASLLAEAPESEAQEAGTLRNLGALDTRVRMLLALVAEAETVVRRVQPHRFRRSSKEVTTPKLTTNIRRQAALFRQNLTLQSRAFRHSLRIGASAALAIVLTQLFHIPHGEWVTLTAVLVLQPSVGATWTKGMERIIGSVVGGLLAAGVGVIAAGSPMIAVVALALAILLARSLLPLNYALFTTFVTVAFVLFAQLAGDVAPVAFVRVVASLGGGVLAFAVVFFLWPERERESARDEAMHAIEATRSLARVVFDPHSTATDYAEARRSVGLANTNAEDAIERVVGGVEDPERQAFSELMIELRRLVAALIALATDREVKHRTDIASASAVDDLLVALRGRLHDGAEPVKLHAEVPADAPLALVERLTALEHVMARWP